MIIFNHKITTDRFPWQPGYNWKGMINNTAPLNRDGARFGAGWKYKLGIEIGGSTVLLNLIIGMVRISKVRKS